MGAWYSVAMKKGNITRILDYYMSPDNLWIFRAEVDRALRDFFRGKTPQSFSNDVTGHFNEWFLYDFHLSMGQTPLEYFCSKNPLRLSSDELAEYESMKENIYNIWEVKEVRKNKGLTLVDVRSKEEYKVKENAATLELQKEDMVILRVVKVSDCWEISGGSSFLLPVSDKNTKFFLKEFKEIEGEINPMMIYQVFSKNSPTQDFKKDRIADTDGEVLVSGSFDGSPIQEDDNCAVCQLMRKTQKEGRQPAKKELMEAMEEVEREKKNGKNK